MCSCFWRTVHVLLTLAAVGCCGWLLWKDRQRSYLSERECGARRGRRPDPRPTSTRRFESGSNEHAPRAVR